ncbi:MAG TPA: helix-turn-helix transcriptional regulator, partial [Micromonospora sp.]
PSPLRRRRRLGSELRKLRETANLTGEQVIERVGWASASKLSRLENGRSKPDLKDILTLLDLYQVTGAVRDELATITRDAGDMRAWLRQNPEVTRNQLDYFELEAGSAEIREYCPVIVPGLLQTPEYARVRIVSSAPLRSPAPGRNGDEDPDAEVRARQARQALLTQVADAPLYSAVIEESAFSGRAGPPEMLRRQLVHLRQMAELTNVTVQVVPSHASFEDWYLPHTAFSLYRFPDPQDPETVAIEGMSTNFMNTDPKELNRYSVVFQWLQGVALTAEETLSWLDEAVERGSAAEAGPAVRSPKPPSQRRRPARRLTGT